MLTVMCFAFATLIHCLSRYIVAERRAERLLQRKNSYSPDRHPGRLIDVTPQGQPLSDPPEWLERRSRSLKEIEQQLHDNIMLTNNYAPQKPRPDQLREKLRQIRDILNKTPELQ